MQDVKMEVTTDDTKQQKQRGAGAANEDQSAVKRPRTVEDLQAELAESKAREEASKAHEEASKTRVDDLRAQIAAATAHPPITFRQIPEHDIKSFLASIPSIDFTPVTIDYSDKAGENVLSTLFKPGTRWPVVKGRLDMRLFSRTELIGPGSDPLRPVARKLSDAIKKTNGKAFGLIAVAATGKTSSTIDVGREHYVVLLQASQANDDDVQSASLGQNGTTRDFDKCFAMMVLDIDRLVWQLDAHKKEDCERAWVLIEQRCMVEIIARMLVVERMRHYFADHHQILEPFDFMQHQLCSDDMSFVDKVVSRIKDWDVPSLLLLAEHLKINLSPILSTAGGTRKLVIAIDETEFARQIYRGLFRRPGTQTDTRDKGLLSPLQSATDLISMRLGLNIILSGTGASYKAKIENMQTHLGKTPSEQLNLFTQRDFPMASVDDVNALMTKLNLPLNLLKVQGGRRDHVIEGGFKALESIVDVMETYVVGARFRILMGALEKIQSFVKTHGNLSTPTLLWEMVLRESIEHHRDGLLHLLYKRVGPNSKFSASRDTVETVAALYVGAAMTNGGARFTETSLNLMGDQQAPPVDFMELAIASVSLTQTMEVRDMTRSQKVKGTGTVIGITEAFVFDALDMYLSDTRVQTAMINTNAHNSVQLFKQVLTQFGPSAQFKGNVVERVLLHRLVELATTCKTVGELPFVQPVLAKNDALRMEWSSLPYTPQRVQESFTDQSTPSFLASNDSFSVVYWPEDVCRPDGIVMVSSTPPTPQPPSSSSLLCVRPRRAPVQAHGNRHAITLACAVYGGTVTIEKVNDQICSSDMSRAFLSKESGNVYEATKKRRKEWCSLGLHKTKTIRVCVTLPFGPDPDVDSAYKETKEEGGGMEKQVGMDKDVLITLDRTNIHLLLGTDKKYDEFYMLLKMATRCWDGWGPASSGR